MKFDDIHVLSELRVAHTNASRVLVDLQRENCTVYMFLNGIDIVSASNQDRALVRSVAIQVWQKHLEEIKAKLMLLGVELP